jgi:hypothetical protein
VLVRYVNSYGNKLSDIVSICGSVVKIVDFQIIVVPVFHGKVMCQDATDIVLYLQDITQENGAKFSVEQEQGMEFLKLSPLLVPLSLPLIDKVNEQGFVPVNKIVVILFFKNPLCVAARYLKPPATQ